MPIRIGKEIDHAAMSGKTRRVHNAGRNMIAVAFAIYPSHAIDSELKFAIYHNAPLLAMRVRRHVSRRLNVKENSLSRFALSYPASHASKVNIDLGK